MKKPLNHSFIYSCAVFACLFFAITGIGNAQNGEQLDVFTLLRNNQPIGEVTASYRREGDRHFYSLTSNVEVRILFKIRVKINYHEQFDADHHLESSSYTQHFNGMSQKDIKLKKLGTSYQIWNDDKKVETEEGLIDLTSLGMYFKEPKGVSQVYSENQLKYVSIVEKGKGNYELTQENGRKSHYQYAEGRLEKIESSSIYGSITIVRNKHLSYAHN
jgi:hypothetical protein